VQIDNRFKQIEYSVSEIRRDQLNYRIEKDLLKDTFSSNFQTVNIIITIILLLFGGISYFGMKDIGSLKKDYSSELEKLRALRNDFEINIKNITEEQSKVKDNYFEIIKSNEEQSKKIKVLELQEKVSSLLHSGNCQRALEYAAVALNLDTDNIVLLDLKGQCLWKLNDLNGSIATFNELLKVDTTNQGAIQNLLELYLIVNRIQEYEELYTKNQSWLVAKNAPVFEMYFSVLKCYQLGQLQQIEEKIKEYLKQFSDEKKIAIKWSFDEVNNFLKGKPASKQKTLIILFIQLLEGKITKKEISEVIDKK
jgi:tetratricopeptide (TPR) repeat protein